MKKGYFKKKKKIKKKMQTNKKLKTHTTCKRSFNKRKNIHVVAPIFVTRIFNIYLVTPLVQADSIFTMPPHSL